MAFVSSLPELTEQTELTEAQGPLASDRRSPKDRRLLGGAVGSAPKRTVEVNHVGPDPTGPQPQAAGAAFTTELHASGGSEPAARFPAVSAAVSAAVSPQQTRRPRPSGSPGQAAVSAARHGREFRHRGWTRATAIDDSYQRPL
ncbi:hypothetical protein EYF80_056131 [Liparis tanakae]|uniref:Uncharacterized protein n=1 Tax=Liparis tanakae TaxID=230148 RepID=A0A4Z2EZM6_9TELE|nr:hypothetical protein EYF80_056131 [Liparis tanakae]